MWGVHLILLFLASSCDSLQQQPRVVYVLCSHRVMGAQSWPLLVFANHKPDLRHCPNSIRSSQNPIAVPQLQVGLGLLRACWLLGALSGLLGQVCHWFRLRCYTCVPLLTPVGLRPCCYLWLAVSTAPGVTPSVVPRLHWTGTG